MVSNRQEEALKVHLSEDLQVEDVLLDAATTLLSTIREVSRVAQGQAKTLVEHQLLTLHSVAVQGVEDLASSELVLVPGGELRVLLVDATVLQEVLHLNQVHAHADHLLEEVLLPLTEEVDLLLVASKGALLGQFLLNAALAILS